jgi:hypothetical protein
MRKWVQVVLAVLLVVLAGVIVWQVLRLREPVYQGKRLSFWLESLCKALGNQDEVDRAEQAIRHIGTNALPVLIEGLHARDTPLKQTMVEWVQKQKLVHFSFKSAYQRRCKAILGYEALGPLASAQVPSLMDTLTNDPSPDVRQDAASALAAIGPEARLAASALFHAAKDTNNAVRNRAFIALARIRPDPHLTVPVLVAGLDDPNRTVRCNAAIALGRNGPEARQAVPALIRMLSDPDQHVRDLATNALKKIDPEAAAKAGVK